MPGPAEPGQILRQLELPPAPGAREEPAVVPRPDAGRPPPNADDIRFVLRQLEIEGSTVYPPPSLLPLYQALIGSEITLRKVFEVASAITRKYRQDGYVLSLAVVPSQRIADGVVRVQVVEGFVDKVVIDGDLGDRGSLVREMAGKIAATRPLTMSALERYLLLIDDLPGLTARAVLKPSETPGAADLVVTVEEEPIDGYATLDNRGSRYVGPLQIGLGMGANSILGYNERTTFRTVVTSQISELKFFEVGQVVPLGAEGTRGRIQASRSYANPGFTLKPEDVHGEATALALAATHPLLRSRAENLSLSAGFDMRWIKADQHDGADLISKDAIRAVRLGADYDIVETLLGRAVDLVALEASQGLDILGARESGSPNLSRANGRSDFTKMTLNVQRQQGLGGGFSLLAAMTAQYAFTPLLAAEEFSFGGAQFGRGYDPAELTGDHGMAGKLELAYGEEVGGKLLQGYQVYGFYDAGAIWNSDHTAEEKSRETASSAGIGARANISPHLSTNIELAVPLTGRVTTRGSKGDDARIFFGLVGRF